MPQFVANLLTQCAINGYFPHTMKTQPSAGPRLNYRQWLRQELVERCRQNPSYSLRAFAKLLRLDPSTVSQLLSGRRNASAKLLAKICERLHATPAERAALLADARRKQKRAFRGTDHVVEDYKQLSLDAFALIADWYHYAILELTSVKGFQSSPRWIARSLGISATEATIALERLKRLELIEDRNERLVRTEAFITNDSGVSTAPALRKLQKDWIGKALMAIDATAPEEKDITSITMAIDVRKIEEARKLIAKFRRDLCAFLEDGEATAVYTMGVQLFPISRIPEEKGVHAAPGENHEKSIANTH
jgi:uncharacterized protein (TIGR02147 family)